MSQITNFFLNQYSDAPYRLKYILQQDDYWMEHTHDYVQWLFPLTVPSEYNPNAPLLTESDMKLFQSTDDGFDLLDAYMVGFNRMMQFFGLEMDGGKLQLKSLRNCLMTWAGDFNHNHLRMTRVIKSLNLVGCDGTAYEVYSTIREYAECKSSIEYWKEAVQ